MNEQEKSIQEKIQELKLKGIDVQSIERRQPIIGQGINFTFFLKSAADLVHLPAPGEFAANTSVAYIKSTKKIYILGNDGWE